jgi:Asp-tRNA(Asn)/Glu-tRNA(Gln) amidotransferase A subunit family amidase
MQRSGYLERVQNADFSPTAELENCLSRVQRLEPSLSAFAHIDVERARFAAKGSTERWAAGKPLSPLDGIVIGLKDVIETFDMPTGQGSPALALTMTGRDAACVEALRQAGAVILGKCTTTEFAFAHPFHRTRNPCDPERTPGGSSSGSAVAVAAGFVHAALGTQVLGSTLRPASYCGCLGYKPSLGSISRTGLFDYQSQGCLGFFGNTLEDLWAIAATIAARAGGEPGCVALAELDQPLEPKLPNRLALLMPGRWGAASPSAIGSLRAAAERIETAGVEICRSSMDTRIERLENELSTVSERSYALVDWEHRWPVNTYRRQHENSVSETLRARIDAIEATMTLDGYNQLLDWRLALRESYATLMKDFDAVLTLSATAAAPLGHLSTGDVSMNIPASTWGAPAVSLPVLSDQNLPLGLQLIGNFRADRALLSHAAGLLKILSTVPVSNNTAIAL